MLRCCFWKETGSHSQVLLFISEVNVSPIQYIHDISIAHHYWVVISNIFNFHRYLGKIPNLTNIFQMGWNHQPDYYVHYHHYHQYGKYHPLIKIIASTMRGHEILWRWTLNMDVSENSGTPKSSIFNRVFHYKPSILGHHYFWKHPYIARGLCCTSLRPSCCKCPWTRAWPSFSKWWIPSRKRSFCDLKVDGKNANLERWTLWAVIKSTYHTGYCGAS